MGKSDKKAWTSEYYTNKERDHLKREKWDDDSFLVNASYLRVHTKGTSNSKRVGVESRESVDDHFWVCETVNVARTESPIIEKIEKRKTIEHTQFSKGHRLKIWYIWIYLIVITMLQLFTIISRLEV